MSNFYDEYYDLCKTIRETAVKGLSDSDIETLREIVGRTQLGADMGLWCAALQDAESLLRLFDEDNGDLGDYIWPDPSEAVSCVFDAVRMYVGALDLIPMKGE